MVRGRWVLGFVALLGPLVAVLVPEAQAWPTDARCPVDAGLVIDISDSMAANGGLPAAQAGAFNYLAQLDPVLDQSALASFSGTGVRDQDFTFNHAATQAAVMSLTVALGGTNHYAGMQSSYDQFVAGARPGARQVMVFLTDGARSPQYQDPAPSPPALGFDDVVKAAGIEIYVIGVGTGVNHLQNQNIASDPDSKYYRHAPTIPDVDGAFQDILVDSLDCRPEVDFESFHNCEGHPYTFRDLSFPIMEQADLANVTWDWGDGSPATTVDPYYAWENHTYPAPGTYTVNLTVFDTLGRFRQMERDIVVDDCPNPDFSCIGLLSPYKRIRFVDLSTDMDGDLTSLQWDLGPGGTSTAFGTFTADYPAPGPYNITLTAWDAHGHTATVTKVCTALDNLPPIIDPHPVYYVFEDELLEFYVTGRDQDSDLWFFGWEAGPGLPATARFDTGTQKFAWKPTLGMRGTYELTRFYISDYEYFDETFVTIVVLPRPIESPPGQHDADGDGVPDRHDNCPNVQNEDQQAGACGSQAPGGAGGDGDSTGGDAGAGDAGLGVDPASAASPPAADGDLDGVADERDNCPEAANPTQVDADRDGVGDRCDPDLDGDGVDQADGLGRALDNCPFAFNPDQADAVGDGVGDACRGDADADGLADADDACPLVAEAGCAVQDHLAGGQDGGADGDPASLAGAAGRSARWPWLLLAAVVLAVGGVAFLGVRKRRRRDEA